MPDEYKRVLETTRLLLRPMRTTDIDELLRIFTDLKVMAAFNCPPFNRQQMSQWLQRNLDHQAEHGYGLLSVILKTNGLLVGDCGLEVMDMDGRQVVESEKIGMKRISELTRHGNPYWKYGIERGAIKDVERTLATRPSN